MKKEIILKIIKNKNLPKEQKEMINNSRLKEWGEGIINFNKDYEPDAKWFFIKKENKIVSFASLRPIKISYLGKRYNILGICSVISIERGKGYGKILISFIIKYFKENKKTGLGFTEKTEFFKKAGLETKKDFIKRFIYKNLKTGKEIIDNRGDGIYYNGKDNFIKTVLSNKNPVYININHW